MKAWAISEPWPKFTSWSLGNWLKVELRQFWRDYSDICHFRYKISCQWLTDRWFLQKSINKFLPSYFNYSLRCITTLSLFTISHQHKRSHPKDGTGSTVFWAVTPQFFRNVWNGMFTSIKDLFDLVERFT